MLLFLACNGAVEERPTGDGVFAEGCPSNDVIAHSIGVDATLPGETAIGTRGDWLVANEHAAYVISSPEKFEGPKGTTYWYYGGAVVDAVAMDGCTPTNDDRLDEFPRRLIGLVNDLAREGGLEFESYAPALADWVEQRRATLLQEPIPTESDGLAAVFALTQYEKGLDQREPSPPVDLVIWIYRDLWREHECVPVNTATMAATLCEMAGVVPLIAEARAPVDSKLHDPVTAVEADGLPAGYVLRTKSPGFRLADGTLRTKARVVVSG